MKTVVGIDLAGMSEPALRLCLDLQFGEQELILVHAVEPVPEYAPPLHDDILSAGTWMQHLREAGREVLRKAADTAASRGVPSRSVAADGSACASLIAMAEQEGAELIVIGSARPGRVAGFLFGSVARGLAIGASQSVLATKQEQPVEPPLSAVFATDLSAYADRCLDRFLRWKPKGLESVSVVTAYEITDETAGLLRENEELLGASVDLTIEAQLRSQCEERCSKLRQAGYRSEASIRKGHPNQVLSEAMAECGANLMIVGAQGHGFLERLFIGSVSLHQVTRETYPVLLIRA